MPLSDRRHDELLVRFSHVNRWSAWELSTHGLGRDPHQIDLIPPDDPGDQGAGLDSVEAGMSRGGGD